MEADFKVSRARLSYLATRGSGKILEELSNPDRFAALLDDPRPVAGLALSLPYGEPPLKGVRPEVDYAHWSNVAEKTKRPAELQQTSGNDRRYSGVPLRHRPPVGPGSESKPRLEIFCLGFGCVAVATLDVFCTPPVALDDLAEALTAAEQTPLETTIGAPVRAPLSELAEAAADQAMAVLSPTGGSWSLSPYRIVSVVSATGDTTLTRMPPADGAVHRAMHALALGGPARPPAGEAFLPYWAGRNTFGWAPSELTYILDTGAAQVRQSAALAQPAPPAWRTSDHHRMLTLARVHVGADFCLLAGVDQAGSGRLRAWAKNAANRQGRLYGPRQPSYDFWSLACRSFILSDPDAQARIEAWRTDTGPLHGSEWPPYPGP